MYCKPVDSSLTSPDLKEVIYQLLHNDGYVPDCYKDMKRLTAKLASAANGPTPLHGVYNNSGELSGCYLAVVTSPGHEGEFYSWFWKPCMTTGVIRAIRNYLEKSAHGLCLDRMVARTADEKTHGRVLSLAGMTLEGRFKNAFKCGGKLRTLYQYRRLF